MTRLAGKRALIAGGGSGISHAFAQAYARGDGQLIIVDGGQWTS